MKPQLFSYVKWTVAYIAYVFLIPSAAGESSDLVNAFLPKEVPVVWDLSRTQSETTPTRERICINGLWRWQPAEASSEEVPEGNWGYFKVPGSWPGITNYMQKDSQTVHRHPHWKDRRLDRITTAWYEREITIPADWGDRRVELTIEYLNSYAQVYIDGTRIGDVHFPGGTIDLNSICHPGEKYQLSLLVVALPLKGVMLSYTDSASAREVKGSVARKGLCGDVFLISRPSGPHITDIRIDTSVRKETLTINTAIKELHASKGYRLSMRVWKNKRVIKEFISRIFRNHNLKDDRFHHTENWIPDKLWDIHTPQHTYTLEVVLQTEEGVNMDFSWPIRFGFREFWIDGRDFYLNGTRLYISTVPFDNAQVSAALATYEAARESMKRLKSFGINLVYTHNYGCQPGDHLSFTEILHAADDVGLLVSFSQPHFSHYDWDKSDADRENGYARHTAFYVRAAQNHPSVVMYSMSHNATGYSEDMNPHMIDGIQEARGTWALRNVKRARRAEAIVKALDPGRIVYHHASGNLGPMHLSNFYPNFVPIQELSDWFEHWATEGVKPVFLCEYGAPFSWDWAMYRGWYQGKREFGSAAVPWEFCLAEWNAQFLGDRAFDISDMEKRNLRWEARQFQAGRVWHRWDYPHRLGSTDFTEREAIFESYATDNWRAFRTWGVSANSPWEHRHLFKLRPGLSRNQYAPCPTDWEDLQRPGFSPDFQAQRYERMDLAYETSDWIPTGYGKAILRNNRPLLAYIGGKPKSFTSKDHLFTADESFSKQIIIINNTRQPVSCEINWSLAIPQTVRGQDKVTVETGQQDRLPIHFDLPSTTPPGKYELSMETRFSTGEKQTDRFSIHVLPKQAPIRCQSKVALFDPRGETTAFLSNLHLPFDVVAADQDLNSYDVLIVGKAAMTVNGPAPDIRRVREGLKVLVFEQTATVLEKRLGFRVTEYGLRQVFNRVPDHPIVKDFQTEHLRDWRGAATILPPRLEYELSPQFNGVPAVQWCGLTVPRAWRCGNRGNVASVLIEKPPCGNFLPLVDGGFSLQFCPLMEYREGQGMVLFCQMDVTGRTESDPLARMLTANMLRYLDTWKPQPLRDLVYIGEPEGKAHLQAMGISTQSYTGASLNPNTVLAIGPGKATSSIEKATIGTFLQAGGRLLGIGLTQQHLETLLPFQVTVEQAEHINATFESFKTDSYLEGIGPADVHNRAPRVIPLVSAGATTVGNGVLAFNDTYSTILCQLVPWQFEYRNNFGLKRTFRRSSFLVARLLSNLGVESTTPLLDRFAAPVIDNDSARYLKGLYLDIPEEWDDPYRFFRW